MRKVDDLPYFTKMRLRFIDTTLANHGSIARSDLLTKFSMSPQAASLDIQTYCKYFPSNAVYNPSTRKHIKLDSFVSAFAYTAEE